MHEEAIRRYAALAVPRYTSFPTAADFIPVGVETTHRWLRQIGPEESVSLYIHVPYCRQLCHYCGCHAKMAVRNDVVENFCTALLSEIETVSKSLTARPNVVHLHWGGGTPSILNPRQFTSILAALRVAFDFSPEMEHAIELDPRTVTPQLARTLSLMGVNRASLGVQDIDAEVQKAIGRIQPIETVAKAASLLREVGIDRLNFDLIYGLPLQTVETLRETCEKVAALKPDRVACYGYAHLPQRRANQRLIDASLLPDADERFVQARVVAESFIGFGYEPVGIDHYALPDDSLAVAARNGTLHRNFQGYTDDRCQTLIGLGPSSISQFTGGYAQNISDVTQYSKRVQAGELATVRGYAMRESDRIRAGIITALMCNFRVDLNMTAPGVEFSDEMALLRPLVADGLVEIRGGVISATSDGKPLIRLVAAAFDEFRRETMHGFSFAV
ncbi:oxygen-independent coproporphyrinogen-3 oxidase [Ochrobactrum intermedium]|uniref:Coproporphyrinogen-III oxidase n=1 Tax=Brucella intermedia TaxID=94625 RepID=A0ABR6AL28_9HYPH|nr:oxygen-independent coproporphyrinogen III oxidase [Brucella intermedia]MBA8850169.1 oxygen-independent coproporphyrinogen-3 oxidase [Brucella intermedia]MCO7737369.1 oxygen-independent coproporphyrinogen III oxidase [Brucella intermedia]MPR63713.1 oxygen-independent coproporphyrinogen III oxidase [Brucella intermedia]OAB85224.1 coproporphyrinogen III oxidase [Brucella intermedia]WLF97227.1 oxygen-independent coproporphyrinogen III oxidase [Brucella intermedia]